MKKLILLVLCAGAWGMSMEHARTVSVERPELATPLMHHLERAAHLMDRGVRSAEYQESIEFLRQQSSQAIDEVSGFLLESKGSFRKWQIAYLIGEFGGEEALSLFRQWVEQPVPAPEFVDDGQHRVDLSFAEEGAARVQAVGSIARIASQRPALRDQAVDELLWIAKHRPELKEAAIFQLRELLGESFNSLRSQFGSEDARRFEPYALPVEWQALLQERKAKHRRQQQERAESQEPLCRTH